MSIHGNGGGDLNPNDPLFAAAQKACMPNTPKLPTTGGNGGPGTGAGGQSSSGIVIGPG